MRTLLVSCILLSGSTVSLAQMQTPAQSLIVKVQSSVNCGIAPIPPVGCRVGACVRDQNRRNCHWTFVCR